MRWPIDNPAPVLIAVALAVALRFPLGFAAIDQVNWPDGLVDDRIAGDYRTVSVPDGPWTWIVGGSSVYFGIDRDAVGPARKSTFERGFPSDVALAVSWALRRTIPRDRWPTRIVWGVTMASLVDRKGEAIHPCSTTVARSRPDPAITDHGLCDDFADRATAADRAARAWGRIDPWAGRRAATRDLAVTALRGAWGLGPPAPTPEDHFDYVGHDPAAVRRNVAMWERFGVFGPDAIHPPLADAAVALGALCRELGVPLTVVAMPEPSDVRGRYDPAGRARFDALLRQVGDEVIDLWDAVPDDGFFDQVHVNAEGRAVLTAALVDRAGLGTR
ncbi:MAG: hypothetical protein ABMB14_05620 [Myxococcota bacterium]